MNFGGQKFQNFRLKSENFEKFLDFAFREGEGTLYAICRSPYPAPHEIYAYGVALSKRVNIRTHAVLQPN